METLEKTEDAIGILGVDPNSVIGHGEYAPAVAFLGCDMDTANLLTAILDGIANQVLKQLAEARFMNRNRRHCGDGDGGAGLLDGSAQAFQDIRKHARGIDVWRGSLLNFRGPGVRQRR
jgi:hypothetical protein